MRVVVQRVKEAAVYIDGSAHASIGAGLLVLLGVEEADSPEDVDWLCRKLSAMRIFADPQGMMNCSIQEAGGSFLVVSQFTLHASTKKGNRPSFVQAARPEVAIPLYTTFLERLSAESGRPVHSGVFGADMQVHLINDGPVTIIMDSKDRA